MDKKRIILSLIAGMIIGLSSHTIHAAELVVTYSPANLSKMYQAVADAFSAKYPDIQVTLQGSPSYGNLSEKTLRASLTGGLPDVSHEGLSYIRRYSDRNLAVPLDEFIAKDPEWTGLGLADGVKKPLVFSKEKPMPFPLPYPP